MGVGELNDADEDVELADAIMVVGADPLGCQTKYALNHWVPNLQGATLSKKRELRPDEPQAAARLVIVDLRRTVNASEAVADAESVLRLALALGIDMALANALLAERWPEVADVGILPDDPGAIRAAIRHKGRALEGDPVLGRGLGGGDGPRPRRAEARTGGLHVLEVAIRPGKPLAIGRVGGALGVGLRGDPFAAAVTFTQIAGPALRRMDGLRIPALADFDHNLATARTEFVPVAWEARDGLGRPILCRRDPGGSASLGPLATAQGLALMPASLDRVRSGQPPSVEPLPARLVPSSAPEVPTTPRRRERRRRAGRLARPAGAPRGRPHPGRREDLTPDGTIGGHRGVRSGADRLVMSFTMPVTEVETDE